MLYAYGISQLCAVIMLCAICCALDARRSTLDALRSTLDALRLIQRKQGYEPKEDPMSGMEKLNR